MEFVRRNLSQKYVKPDEREIVKARIQQQGAYQIIDKVSVVAQARSTTSTGRRCTTSTRTTSTSTRTSCASTTGC